MVGNLENKRWDGTAVLNGYREVGLTYRSACKEKHAVGPLLMPGTWRTDYCGNWRCQNNEGIHPWRGNSWGI